MTKQAILYRLVSKDHMCPYGFKAKYLLRKHGYVVDDHHLSSHEEAIAFKQKHDVKTTPQIFIDGKRIGGYEDLQEYLGIERSDKNEPSYTPIIILFATTFFLALLLEFRFPEFSFENLLMSFVAMSMIVLGVLKLRDLHSFTNQFLSYDLLSQKYVPYAYIYPFAETSAGVLMMGQILQPIAAITALFIGTIGALSVIKAVIIDKRKLKCACVGGNSSVPLGFVSLSENVGMIVMGLYMLFFF